MSLASEPFLERTLFYKNSEKDRLLGQILLKTKERKMKSMKPLYIAIALAAAAIYSPHVFAAEPKASSAISEDDVSKIVERVTTRMAEQSAAKDETTEVDKKYDRLSCKSEKAKSKFDGALCIAGNLDQIHELSATKRKYATLYAEAIRSIKSELRRSYETASDSESLTQARTNYDQLADAVSGHDNSELKRAIEQLKPSLERAAADRMRLQAAEKQMTERIMPGLDGAYDDLVNAENSGDRFAAYRAQSNYDTLVSQAQRYTRGMRIFDPMVATRRMNEISGTYSNFFDQLYQQTMTTVQDSMDFYQQYATRSNRTIGGGDSIGDPTFSPNPRQGNNPRNPGFTPYNPYGSTGTTRPQGTTTGTDDWSASGYMNGRGPGRPRS